MTRLGRWVAALWSVCALAAALCAPASAVDRVVMVGEDHGDYARITITWPESLGATSLTPVAEVEHGVAVVKFTDAIAAEIEDLASDLGRRAALTRLDPTGQALRIALIGDNRLHVTRSHNIVAVDLIDASRADNPPAVDSPFARRERAAAEDARRRAEAAQSHADARANPPPLPLNVRAAQSAEYSRLVFDWTTPVGHSLVNTDGAAEVRFARDAVVELRDLRVSPVRGIETMDAKHSDDGLVVHIALEDGYGARSWSDGGQVVVDVVPNDILSTHEDHAHQLHAAADPVLAHETASAHGDHGDGYNGDVDHDAATDHSDHTEPDHDSDQHHEPSVAYDAHDDHGGGAHAAIDHGAPYEATHDLHSEDGHGGAHAEEAYSDGHPNTHQPAGVHTTADEHDGAPAHSAVIKAEVTTTSGGVHAAFQWPHSVGAAAFRRGRTVWIVFDNSAPLDLGQLIQAGGRRLTNVQALRGKGYSAIRAIAPRTTQVSAIADGDRWTFVFSEAAAALPQAIQLERGADETGGGRLTATLHHITNVLRIADPEVGDELLVVTAGGPVQALLTERSVVEATAFASAHGLAFEQKADDLEVFTTEHEVVLTRADGLRITPRGPSRGGVATATPGLIDFVGWSGAATDFIDDHDALARRAAASESTEDRLALAQFLVGNELGPEALGVLEFVARDDPHASEEAQFLALRGAANVLTGRLELARDDFSAPTLQRDAAASLWRGWLAAQEHDWRDARRQFEQGSEALTLFRSDWRGRLLAAEAEAALELGDVGAAKTAILRALGEQLPSDVEAGVRLAEAGYYEQTGDLEHALELAREVAESGYEPAEVEALHVVTRLERALGEITEEEVFERLETLRFRWRGDDAEFDIVTELGRFYVEQGDARRGLMMMRAAVKRFPNTPAARDMSIELSDIFSRLYIDGEADRMDPVQALALWYEFSDLTPIGAEGDFMIRRLADRLVDFDLLPQAAGLLQHQVDERLRGAAKAQVATDLAAVYLMDRRPEDALAALARSRITRLPEALNAERRLMEARALAEIGREEHALELLAADQSPAARTLKADIAWKLQDWPRAGALLEAAAGEAWRGEGLITPTAESAVLRAAIAYSFADDKERMARLEERYGRAMANGREAAAWRLIADGSPADGVRMRELVQRLGATDTLESFLDDFRARRQADAPTPAGPAAG